MTTVIDVARAHLRRQRAIGRRAAEQAGRYWAEADPDAIDLSWQRLLRSVLDLLTSAQLIAAASSGAYLDDAADALGVPPGSEGRIRPDGFAGIASDGRPLQTLLYRPVVTALRAIKAGHPVRRAMASGRLTLDLIVRTQVADAGRAADGVALAARPQIAGWVRMLSEPSCSRCIILAGQTYRWSDGFERHDRCDCKHIPASEDVAGDLRTDPRLYFESLPPDEQDRIFTAAGAQAIRDGADIARVVNARRGMYTAAARPGAPGRLMTREGITRSRRRVRPMPETIYAEAGDDRDEALRLLRVHGYLT